MASTSIACSSRSFAGSLPQKLTALTTLFIFVFILTSPYTAYAQQEAFIEANGLVVIQAESVEPAGDWVEESSDSGFTGTGYLRWNGPNLYGTPGVGTLAYTVYISEPGEYNVRIRMSHLGAPAGDLWNDCWARMNDGRWAKALHPGDKMEDGFTFDSILEPDFGVFENMRYTLSAGFHTLYLSGRSENLRMDRIHFYKDSVPNPLNLSLPESEFRFVEEDDDGNDDDGEDTPEPTTVDLAGELKKWHPVTLTMDGPQSSEDGTPNPFLDYRFQVTFSQDALEYTVPGYFAADGNADETSSNQGNKWRAHFVPPTTGTWDYVISMRSGTDISVDTSPFAGTPTSEDGITGSFNVEETDKSGRDHRSKGMLRYVNQHYLQFDNGEYYLKGGANSPENFLAYTDFDGTYNNGGSDYTKRYEAHITDWDEGNPTWRNGRGKGIIGAVNYLSNEGMNSVHFITMNVNGDGNDVWPWTSPTNFTRFDVSKLAQWERVFSHMDERGIMLHVLLQETENELLLNNGELERERKVYYRELVARFAHHHALTWNLGEENDDNSDAQRKAFASYIRSIDAYNHPIVVHTYPGQQDDIYTPLLGFGDFEGISLQMSDIRDIHLETLKWRDLSAQNGRPWIVSLDEIGPYQVGVTENGVNSNHDEVRHHALWSNLMAGGAGVEWYFGSETGSNDLTTEDWRTRSGMWKYTRHALEFFQTHLPYSLMGPFDELTPNESDYVFAAMDSLYAIYMPEGDSLKAHLPPGQYALQWYNPRSGGELQAYTEIAVENTDLQFIGSPPGSPELDWVALISQISVVEEELLPIAVTGFTLVDADTDMSLGPLTSGDVLNLAELPPHLNVVAETRVDPGQRITHVYLELQPTDSRRKESVAPYALFGDLSGNFLPGTFDQGSLTLTATPFGLDGASDQAGSAKTISFTITGINPETEASKHIGESEEGAGVDVGSDSSPEAPDAFSLESNYPNPFNPSTTIPFNLRETGHVRMTVYDMQGREIRVLIDGVIQPGQHQVTFDAANLPSGTYMYRLDVEGQRDIRQMVLLK